LRRALAVVAAIGVLAAGCGGNDEKPTIKVSAASSLKTAFASYGKRFAQASTSFSFAGSDELAAQIRQGVKPDVYAAANTKLPDDLYARGLVEKPVEFAANRLVIAIPAGTKKVRSIHDLAGSGITIAAGAATVPVGSYTRQVIERLRRAEAAAIEHNIRSNEPDVSGVVGKVAEDAVDAGFVYTTDVKASGGKLDEIVIPARLEPRVVYGAAVVKGAGHPAEAKRFIDGLLAGEGQRALADAGFLPPPR
jgi:molybdate transport system substrate-binding protein